MIVTDPDSVLNSLTREIKEIGPDGQEVMVVYLILYCTMLASVLKTISDSKGLLFTHITGDQGNPCYVRGGEGFFDQEH